MRNMSFTTRNCLPAVICMLATPRGSRRRRRTAPRVHAAHHLVERLSRRRRAVSRPGVLEPRPYRPRRASLRYPPALATYFVVPGQRVAIRDELLHVLRAANLRKPNTTSPCSRSSAATQAPPTRRQLRSMRFLRSFCRRTGRFQRQIHDVYSFPAYRGVPRCGYFHASSGC